ncbi:MAG: helix-turn-helix domain-containing protein [Oscillospiraceae bacterium]|nr:helix-turn-helix domain-containing protein [Oscillospiraceae bacterium]
MELKDKLKNRRKELKLTLEDIGRAVGVSAATISRWESGDIENMRRDRIVLYAKVLNAPIGFIMDGELQDRGMPTDDDIKFALFEGIEGISDEMYEEVKRFARMIKREQSAK